MGKIIGAPTKKVARHRKVSRIVVRNGTEISRTEEERLVYARVKDSSIYFEGPGRTIVNLEVDTWGRPFYKVNG